MLLFAAHDQDDAGSEGRLGVRPRRRPGPVTREEEKLGLNSSSTVDLAIEGAHVGRERLLHEEGKGFNVAMCDARRGAIGIAAPGAWDRAGGVRRRARVRARAAAVREADRGLPGDPVGGRSSSAPAGCSLRRVAQLARAGRPCACVTRSLVLDGEAARRGRRRRRRARSGRAPAARAAPPGSSPASTTPTSELSSSTVP